MEAQGQNAATPSRRERRAAETRERLFRSALRLFAERGVANTTVEDITNAADVGKGTFFNYFPSKDHVLAELASIQIGKVSQAASAVESGASTRQVFRSLIRALAEEPARTPNLSRSLLIGILSSDATREFITSRFAEGRQVLARILALGQHRGEVRRDFEPLDIAMVFQQQLFGTIVMWSIHPGMDLGRMLDTTLEVYLHGICEQAENAASSGNARKTRTGARKGSL